MNTPSDAVPESPLAPQEIARVATMQTRPLYWSIRRELWENRSIYIAPLIVAAVQVIGLAISTIGLPERRRAVLLLDPAQQRAAIEKPYDIAAMLLLLTAFLVGVFYCLDALHGERRDRTMLFWKSLPVSDRTTVLSKASIPLVVLPLLTFAITIGVQLIMLLMSDATSAQLPFLQRSAVLLYGLIVMALWHAPIYGWLLLVSGWARRAAFLWAGLPLAAICVVEKIAFNTSHFAVMLQSRLSGGPEAGTFPVTGSVPIHALTHLAPLHFLSSPGLWIGLVVFAAFLAAAVRL